MDEYTETSMVPVPQPAQVAMATVSADQFGHIEARIRADAQVRTMMAIARPRDLDVVRERMLKDAARPTFAEAATYSLPRGGKSITGPTIRFAESALRAYGNVTIDTVVLHEDEKERSLELVIVDLESNMTFREGFVVPKVIERRNLPPRVNQEDIIGKRVNAEGQTLYLLKASDADVRMMGGAVASRVMRNLALRIIPGDLIEEAQQRCKETRNRGDASDPAAARKRIADAFAGQGVSVGELKEYLGHPLDSCSPAELETLRGLFGAIRDGTSTWAEVISGVRGDAEKATSPARKAAATLRDTLDKSKAPPRQPGDDG